MRALSILKAVGYLVAVVLFFFASIYALAATYEISRLAVSLVLFTVGISILFLVRREKPKELVQRVEIPGRIKAQEIRCPNCSALLSMDQTRLVAGTLVLKCSYCGHTSELIEEPKW